MAMYRKVYQLLAAHSPSMKHISYNILVYNML